MTDNILTQDAFNKLKDELEFLKSKRHEIITRIETALSHGDLSENFDYHDAKDTQGFNESRINEIENLLKQVKIVEKTNTGKIGLGSRVTVEVGGKTMLFEIVSFNQADPSSGKISNESPLGSALLGQSKGDTAKFKTPAGLEITYTVISIE